MEWVEFYKIEPFGLEVDDTLHAHTCSLMANLRLDPESKKEPYTIKDFLLYKEPEPEKILTPEEIEAEFAKAWG